MRIDFDAGNTAELAAVAALIANLRGETFGGILHYSGDQDVRFVGELCRTDEVDASEAFDAPAAETVFAAPPAAAPIAAPPPPAGVEVDKSGLPWDARIHSGPAKDKPKNADGTWRKKRGVDDATVAAVTAELRAAMQAPAPGNAVTAPAAAVAPTPAQPAPPPIPAAADMASGQVGAAPAAEPVAVPPPPSGVAVPLADTAPAVATPPPPSPAPSTGALSFADLMRKITGLQTAGALTVEQTAEISAALQIGGVRDLMHRPDLIPSFDALLPAMPTA